jgi:hypothetical protein
VKFRLAMDDHELNGYKLISPIRGQNPIKIGEWIDDGEAKEIIVENILEYLPVESMTQYINMLVAKLQHGGILTIVGNDLVILCEQFARGEINIIEFNKILFGLKNHAWNFKTSCITLGDINDIAKLAGVKVIERKLDGFTFVIKVERQ